MSAATLEVLKATMIDRDHVVREYDWAKVAVQYEELYAQCQRDRQRTSYRGGTTQMTLTL